MRIEHLHIYGFGHLTDVELQFSTHGMHVLYGPNEAGKTTLLAFIRAILFGFDSSNTKKRYEPVFKGEYGGKITFLASADSRNGPITIERTFHGRALRGDVRVYDRDGNALVDDTFMLEPFHHLSAQVYQSIYAFGLDELEDFQSLSSQDVQARIQSAGMGLGSISPIEIEKKLEQKKLSLYRKRGQDQPLTKLLRKKQELRSSLQQLSTIPEQYTQLQQDLANLKEKIEQLKQQKSRLEKEHDQATTFAHLRQLWEEIAPLETVLNRLPDFPVCTRDMFQQWEMLQRDQQVIEERIQAYSEQIATCNRQIAAIQTDEIWNQQWEKISRMYEARHVFTEWENRCQQLNLEIQQVTAKLQNILGQLEEVNDLADWRKIPTTFVTYEEIRMFEQSRQSLTEQIPLQQVQLEQLQKQLEMAVDESSDVNGKLAGLLDTSEPDGTSLEQFQQSLKYLHMLFSELQQLTYRRTSLEERIEHLQQDLNRMQQNKLSRKQKSRSQPKTRYFIAFVLVIVTILAALGILWPAWRTVMIMIGFVTLLLGSVFLVFIRQLPNGNETDPFLTEAERIRQVLQQAQTNLNLLAIDIEAKTLQMHTIAEQSGIKVTGQSLQQLQYELDQLTQALFRQRTLSERIEELRAQQKDCEQKQEKLQKQLQKVKCMLELSDQQRENWQNAWNAWLQNHHLPITLTPESARQYLQLVERAKECLDIQQNRDDEWKRYQLDKEHFIQEVHSIQKKLSQEPVNEREIIAAVQMLYEQASQNRMIRAHKLELEQSVEHLQSVLKQTEAALQVHLQAVDDWLGAYGFLDLQQVSESFEHTQKKQQLEEELNILYLKLEAIIGSRTLLDQHLPNIRAKDVSAWSRIVQDTERELTGLLIELDECKMLQGKLESEISRLEMSTDKSQLQQHMQLLDAEIKDLAAEWSIYTITQKFLELARLKYERERQPAVLQKASEMFRIITKERYGHVRSPLDQSEIRVLTSDQSALSTLALSRGTTEQLYITMRFALIDELLQKGVHAPVIMDDVFVNFDPERLQTTIQVLENMAKSHQILFLTCQPHILQSLQIRIQPCQIIEFFYGRQDFAMQ